MVPSNGRPNLAISWFTEGVNKFKTILLCVVIFNFKYNVLHVDIKFRFDKRFSGSESTIKDYLVFCSVDAQNFV